MVQAPTARWTATISFAATLWALGFALAAERTVSVSATDASRPEVSLNGPWSCQIVPELQSPPPSGPWKPCTVPGYLTGTDYQRAWFRRTFEVPASMQGKRIKIHFGGVKFNSRVFVNGHSAGGCFGGYEPFEIDVTGLVRFDAANELAVGCHDWTGVFTPGKIEVPKHANWDAVRGAPRDKVLSPIGGLFGLYGIWDDVTLRACPAVHVKDVFVKPSVRRAELVLDYVLANESDRDAEVEIRAAVEDGGRDLVTLPATRIVIAAGKSASVTVRRPWKDAPLWSHVDPHLLSLRTELSTGDCLRTRFGFREFWTEGHRFYLNGARVNLLASSWWPPHAPITREEIRKQWEAIKRAGPGAWPFAPIRSRGRECTTRWPTRWGC
jgi:beta-galactosidase